METQEQSNPNQSSPETMPAANTHIHHHQIPDDKTSTALKAPQNQESTDENLTQKDVLKHQDAANVILQQSNKIDHHQAAESSHNDYQYSTQQNQNVRLMDSRKQAYNKNENMQSYPLKVTNINQMVQIKRKRPRMKYTEKQNFKQQKERQIYSQQVQSRAQATKKFQKILDGFLLLFSCRVKLPHEAIRSKLASENIVDVREEDLIYFKNLTYLDVSDNQIMMSQLSNLTALQELDLQYNQVNHLQIHPGTFPMMHTLHLSYNKIPPSHLCELVNLPRLQVLNIASNDFCTLPNDLSFLNQLQELNLSSNNFSSESTLVNPDQLFKSISTIRNLRKLNLSRNKFEAFHNGELPQNNLELPRLSQVFPYLEELYFAFNVVQDQAHLMYAVSQLPQLKYLVITGNPFAITGEMYTTDQLETIMSSKGGQLVNETLNPPTYLRQKKKNGNLAPGEKPPLMLNYAFQQQSKELVHVDDKQQRVMVVEPSSIQEHQRPDLNNQDKQQFLEGTPLAIEYNAEVLEDRPHEGQQHIFRDQNDQPDQAEHDQRDNKQFFITEDLNHGQNNNGSADEQEPDQQQDEVKETNDQRIENEEDQEDQESASFAQDYGRHKLEHFKKSAREILGVVINHQGDIDASQVDYTDGQSLDIVAAYKELKKAVLKSTQQVVNTDVLQGNKGYMKLTIAAQQHGKQRMNKELLKYSLGQKRAQTTSHATRVGTTRAGTTAAGTRGNLNSQPQAITNGQYYLPMDLQNKTHLNNGALPPLTSSASDYCGSGGNKIGQPRKVATAPCWRKTRAEKVDSKVEKLFESYRMIDQVTKAKKKAREGEHSEQSPMQRTAQNMRDEQMKEQRKRYFNDFYQGPQPA